MAKAFTAKVTKWARGNQGRLTAVFRDSAQTVANEVRKDKGHGGNMPVDTGNLRRSLIISTVEMPTINTNAKDFKDRSDNIKLTIAKANIGQTIYLGFQAVYARRMEYGFVGEDSLGRTYNQKGNGFVRLTAQRWPQIVRESILKIKARVEARNGNS